MKIFEIAEKIGVPVSNLSPESIELAIKQGIISRKQGEFLSAELNKADGIWENQAGNVPVAKRLW